MKIPNALALAWRGKFPAADITLFFKQRNSAASSQGGADKRDGGISNSEDGVEEEAPHHSGGTGRRRFSRQGLDRKEPTELEEFGGEKQAIEVTDDEEGDGEPMVDEKFPPSPPRFWTPLASFIGGAGKKKRKWGGLLGQSSPIRRLFTQPSGEGVGPRRSGRTCRDWMVTTFGDYRKSWRWKSFVNNLWE